MGDPPLGLHLYGGCASIFQYEGPELILEGPAGTGKSFAWGHRLNQLAMDHPGCRLLVLRKTRESLSESWCITFEEKVLRPGHPVCTPAIKNRRSYDYQNGSRIILGGMGNAQQRRRLFSTEYDLCYCFPGDTVVESPSAVVRAYRRLYLGPLIRIRTAGGHDLTGTPNHPVLTDHGWVALGKLQQGDHVVRRLDTERVGGGAPDVEHDPSTIADVFRAVSLSGSSRAERVEGIPMDFHGDGCDGDVEVVTPARPFHLARDLSGQEPFPELNGERADFELSSVVSVGPSCEMLVRPGAAEIGGTGVLETSGPLFGGPRPPRPCRAERLGDGLESAFPFDVAFDHIVDCRSIENELGRHVYNLETKDHYYIAGGIVAHNCNECTEVTEGEWESLHRALRHNVIPFQQLGGDCNPDAEYHWANQRMNALRDDGSPRCMRFLTRHENNPSLTPAYLERLRNLTGIRRKRLYEGLWVTAEGCIWEDFDPYHHVIEQVPRNAGEPVTRWFFCSVDWGFRAPGVMQLWGVDVSRRAYLVREIYVTGRNPDWWASKAVEWQKTYDPRVFVCDPAEPDSIDLFNQRLRAAGGRCQAVPANNDFKAGSDVVRERLVPSPVDKRPRIFFLRDAREARYKDHRRDEDHLPTSTIQEIPSYCYAETKDGQAVKEEPARDAEDHGCDAMRYAMVYLDYSGHRPPAEHERGDAIGTWGDLLGIGETLRKSADGFYDA